MDRRDFIGWIVAGGAAVKSTLSWGAPRMPAAANAGFSILQGMTDETSAQFSIVLPQNESLTVMFAAVNPLVQAPVVTDARITKVFSDYGVSKYLVENLVLGETYTLKIHDAAGILKDEREFRALDLSRRNVRIAFLSCALDHLHRNDVWRQFAKQKPDLALFVGDNVYLDRKSLSDVIEPDPQSIWERYVATRLKISFYFQKKLTPVLAIWDDHDFGGNDSMAGFKYTAETTEIFHTFFAQDPRPALTAGPGIARRLSAFGADFFLLDGRTHRMNPETPDGIMFGDAQDLWLTRNLNPRSTLLLNGSVFFGAYGDFESFEGDFNLKFKAFLAQIKASGALAAFVSGDVHYSEIMDIEAAILGYSTFELVTSSIHSFTFPGHHNRYNNPRRREADSNHNFMIFDGVFGDDEMQGEVTCWGAGIDQFNGRVSARRT